MNKSLPLNNSLLLYSNEALLSQYLNGKFIVPKPFYFPVLSLRDSYFKDLIFKEAITTENLDRGPRKSSIPNAFLIVLSFLEYSQSEENKAELISTVKQHWPEEELGFLLDIIHSKEEFTKYF